MLYLYRKNSTNHKVYQQKISSVINNRHQDKNSLRFADTTVKPFITISISADKHDNVSITVSDTGPGIAEEIRDKLFEPFFTTSSTGNGLGLYIARKICLSNHGYLDYIHEKNGRAFFRVTLPDNNNCQQLSDGTLK